MTQRENRFGGLTAGATLLLCLLMAPTAQAQNDPASEPTVLAVAKVLPAVVNINTERVVRRRVRDPFEDFAAQYFGNYRSQPREIRQTLQSLGSGFVVDPAGYIITNQHVVARAADLKIEVTMNDGKTYTARYITVMRRRISRSSRWTRRSRCRLST
jgi:S1-C subfamily serine protease